MVSPKLVAVVAGLAVAAAPAGAPPILDYLTQTIDWYQDFTSQALSPDAAELVYFSEGRRTALEVLRLAFQYARGQVALAPAATPAPSGQPQPSRGLNAQVLQRMAQEAEAHVKLEQDELQTLLGQLASTQKADRPALEQHLAEARSELSLEEARLETVRGYLDFLGPGAAAATGLSARIDELERSVPEARADDTRATPAAPQKTQLQQAAPTGILALSTDLLSLARKRRNLRQSIAKAQAVRALVIKLRDPLEGELRTTLQQGDQLTGAPDTNDPAMLAERRKVVDELTAHFRKVSGALLPLGKQAVLLDGFTASLTEWHTTVAREFDDELGSLFVRLIVLVVAVSLILAASELWRRATFRYVQDVRRRHQFLLLRRIVVAVALTLFIVFALATEIGSLATFAGFITAGLAVALQNVILSIAAYFFLIGKYGVRIGDRVQISGVNGDVIDIGLVRLHLLELGPGAQPTGRVVVFSNAVLFQPAANFFKQLPGSSFTWHRVSLTLSPGSDYKLAETRLLSAIERVFAEYQAALEAQHRRVSQELAFPLSALKPQSQLRLTDAGLEMIIRFPVPLESASAIDDRMTRSLLEEIRREPGLRLVGTGAPKIEDAAHAT